MSDAAFRVTIRAEPKWFVSANQRIHWGRRAAVQKHWREQARVAAKWWGNYDEPMYRRATVEAVFRFPTNRRRDVHNLVPLVVKPSIDGCVDANLIHDDDDRHLLSTTVSRAAENGPHELTLIWRAA